MNISHIAQSADIASLVSAYTNGHDPRADLDATFDRIEADASDPVWISTFSRSEAHEMLRASFERLKNGEHLPLFGIMFAVKDNIDVAGLPTTAGCPDFSYHPARSATVVERLISAGAIPIGKTNLDQFATGLNGTRSPYGIPTSVFDDTRVSGGSSSGSAVAVASGLVSFALGTDTAGSGRVPAAFNNLVGLKPTRGLFSSRGVVPACRSLDCVSILAHDVADARLVAQVMAGFDGDDFYSRASEDTFLTEKGKSGSFRFGVPSESYLARCDGHVLAGFHAETSKLEHLGGIRVEIDFEAFDAAANLLYSGPWVAERLAAIEDFAKNHPDSIHPAVRDIILSGRNFSAVDAFVGQYRLAELIRSAEAEWAKMDVLVVPTVPCHPTVQDMLDNPIALNTKLGAYTNFVNLMDLSALAIPAGFPEPNCPVGITLIGSAFDDGYLTNIASRLQYRQKAAIESGSADQRIQLAVVGAHLSGQPLNRQFTERGAALVETTRTSQGYSLYALSGTTPPKPGLIFNGGAGGLEVEIWSLSAAGFGAVVAEIPAPLGIGTITLEDGRSVKSFLCENHALKGATDITAYGGWRGFLAR